MSAVTLYTSKPYVQQQQPLFYQRIMRSPLFWGACAIALSAPAIKYACLSHPKNANHIARIFAFAIGAALRAMPEERRKVLIYEMGLGATLLCERFSPRYTEITPHLIMGVQPLRNKGDLERLKNQGVVAVLSMVKNLEAQPSLFGDPLTQEDFENEGIAYLNLPTEDFGQVAVSDLDEGVEFIHSYIWKGKVLVHCKSGIQRSAYAAICFLMKYGTDPQNPQQMRAEAAESLVRSKRFIIARASSACVLDYSKTLSRS